MSDLARRQISLTLWRWTADGVDARGIVHQDALKYSTVVHPATEDALDALQQGSAGVRHEHIVPRAWITGQILKDSLYGESLHSFLSRVCRAALVTKEEDGKLLPRADMPVGWNHRTGNIYQRYIDTDLYDVLRNVPKG